MPLAEVSPPATAPQEPSAAVGQSWGVDYTERQERNRATGLEAELMVVEHERAWLRTHGRPDLAERVAHIPSTLGDGAGYDVGSFLLDGTPHHIEVKATRGGIATPFFMSANELSYASHHPAAYSIYRLFNLGPTPGFYKITGNMTEILDLTPVTYQARLKAPDAPGT